MGEYNYYNRIEGLTDRLADDMGLPSWGLESCVMEGKVSFGLGEILNTQIYKDRKGNCKLRSFLSRGFSFQIP